MSAQLKLQHSIRVKEGKETWCLHFYDDNSLVSFKTRDDS